VSEVGAPESRSVHLALDRAEEVLERRRRLDDDGRLLGLCMVHEYVDLELDEPPRGGLRDGEGQRLLLGLLLLLLLEHLQVRQDMFADLVEIPVDLFVGVAVPQLQVRDLGRDGRRTVAVLERRDLPPDLPLDVPRFPHDALELDPHLDDLLPDLLQLLTTELVLFGHRLELLKGHGTPFHDGGDVLPGEGAHLELHELETLLQQPLVEVPDDLLLFLPV